MSPGHRRLIWLRGPPEATAQAAAEAVRDLPEDAVLQVGRGPGALSRGRLRRHLGRTLDAVVVDLHHGPDPDALGMAHGLVRGGGALVLRGPPAGEVPSTAWLAVEPWPATAVGRRLWDRWRRRLEASAVVRRVQVPGAVPRLAPPTHEPGPTTEQEAVVAVLRERLSNSTATVTVLLAARGRGKSAALGLALRDLPGRIALAAPHPDALAEVQRFAGRPLPMRPLRSLLEGDEDLDVLVLDEAAGLSLPLLRRLIDAHPRARLALATTTDGYEGTGRGFVLRVLDALERGPRPVRRLTLDAPIRWAPDDPVEGLVRDLLLLDAAPAAAPPAGAVHHAVLDRDALARDEPRLRQVVGLLLHAHYRTTPGDVHRLLDAPGLQVHALLQQDRVVAVSLQAAEGRLSPDRVAALARGEGRLRGQVLADTLLSHTVHPEAATWALQRSVRTVVHPDLRRRGLGHRLVEAVHAAADDDLDALGTVFSATAGVVAFRQAQGYRVVRVGTARSARSGEPAVVMVRPKTPRACALVRDLRRELARTLPGHLRRLARDEGLPLEPALVALLERGLPPPSARPEAQARAALRAWLDGPRPLDTAFDVVASAVAVADLSTLPDPLAALVRARILDERPWPEVACLVDPPTVPVAMRALKHAVRRLLGP